MSAPRQKPLVAYDEAEYTKVFDALCQLEEKDDDPRTCISQMYMEDGENRLIVDCGFLNSKDAVEKYFAKHGIVSDLIEYIRYIR